MVIETIIVIIKTIIIEIKIIKIKITLVTKGDISMIIADGIKMAIIKDKMIIMTMIIMETKCVIKERTIGINIIKDLKGSNIIIGLKDNKIIIEIKDNNTKDRVIIMIGNKIFKGKNINIPKISISTKSKKDKIKEMINKKIRPLNKK